MRKFVCKVLSGLFIVGSFGVATETIISDSKLLYASYNGKFVCYKTLENIISGEYSVYLINKNRYDYNERKLELDDLKQLEFFDEFKIARQIEQNLNAKDNEIEKQLEDRYKKMRDIAIKMGCVGQDKKDKIKWKGNDSWWDPYDMESVTFDYSLKEVYEEILKELK
ncbi:hypothetical protein DCO58_12105 [Helicobacter saguini]|uniref:Uncharacterized protein n=1 Tax=Helicobacter saguini TaxID=1548018 RepID=A0A099BC64_9HELI|nr:hypothetical protein [Helicobacter saguini]MWV60968.1 hypothetical protein [Helicobacter saguini]MWV68364.1 hypothetical protein [Helicobacter saguini]MWV70172.1 hypothetical protein [Helicobacter saguini]MWV72075.1 hypothetical protein [Helicobacter saguini]TLD93705.1 hypothetical protein LS64_007885 [Helicobacter saguini]